MQKVMIAMSGGVDSSVAAYLMKEAGYTVIGGMLRLHDKKDFIDADSGCCTTQDIEDARMVAKKLDIPFHLFDYTTSFNDCVIDDFVNCYRSGGTPNPCVTCNRTVKFPLMLQEAKKLGCDLLATGHYARTERDERTGRYLLKKAVDLSKDQSYVLYGLTQAQLAHIVFPLGEKTKDEARVIAQQAQLLTAHKSDSQDICFIPKGDYASFIESYTGTTFPKGKFVDKQGQILGIHQGMIRYTIGQRKGLGLALPAPMYVVEKSMQRNEVVLGFEPDLMTTALQANHINLISVDKIEGEVAVKARVRYQQVETDAIVKQTENATLQVTFAQPQRAVTKGQSVVLYQDDQVLGGGTIL